MRIRKKLQLEILQNYFSFQGNVATLRLVYDTFAELINPNFGDDKIEKLNERLFTDIREALELLPRRYKLNLHIVINDFGPYTIEECQTIVEHNVLLSAYSALKMRRIKMGSGLAMVGVGAIILLLSYLFRSGSAELWFDLLNISGTLFVWEGVNLAFIERNKEARIEKKLAKMIQSVTFEKGTVHNEE